MTLITLLVLILVFGVIAWIIQVLIPMPAPWKNIALAVLGLIFIVYLLGGLGFLPAGRLR